ncbi:MAG: alpha/beta fold hydrolase [Pseudomonadota bacterium]|nr:alpha/beta fold hydrolase [Pseudomonadota bacterium]
MEEPKRFLRIGVSLGIQALIITILVVVVLSVWRRICGGAVLDCLIADNRALSLPNFLALASIRPLLFTPVSLTYVVGAQNFGIWLGAISSAVGATLSSLLLYMSARAISEHVIKGWLRRNFPNAHKLIKAQHIKIILLLRLFPLLYFDLCSLLFGLLFFRRWQFIAITFICSFIEALLVGWLVMSDLLLWQKVITTLGVTFAMWLAVLVYVVVADFIFSRRVSLFKQVVASYREVIDELHENNEIVIRKGFSSDKPPILLLYGFFSSRSCLATLERMLTNRGHDVICFNLGGLFGAFFTESIISSAETVDKKLKLLFEQHDLQRINIVAHSKGGLVALWWLLKMGGSKYCSKLITMATPFCGSRLTYIGIATPFALYWHDLWQMRPNSYLLRQLRDCSLPDALQMHCVYSIQDAVTRGRGGVFTPKAGKVSEVPMHHVKHLEFLFRHDVGDVVSVLLGQD